MSDTTGRQLGRLGKVQAMFKELSTRYEPAAYVQGGLYWNRKTWEFVDIPDEGGQLPDGKYAYHRIPVVLAIGMAPVVGLGFILFLPLAVPPVLLYTAGKAAALKFSRWRGKVPASESTPS